MADTQAPHLSSLTLRAVNEAFRRVWQALNGNVSSSSSSGGTAIVNTETNILPEHDHDDLYFTKAVLLEELDFNIQLQRNVINEGETWTIPDKQELVLSVLENNGSLIVEDGGRLLVA